MTSHSAEEDCSVHTPLPFGFKAVMLPTAILLYYRFLEKLGIFNVLHRKGYYLWGKKKAETAASNQRLHGLKGNGDRTICAVRFFTPEGYYDLYLFKFRGSRLVCCSLIPKECCLLFKQPAFTITR